MNTQLTDQHAEDLAHINKVLPLVAGYLTAMAEGRGEDAEIWAAQYSRSLMHAATILDDVGADYIPGDDLRSIDHIADRGRLIEARRRAYLRANGQVPA